MGKSKINVIDVLRNQAIAKVISAINEAEQMFYNEDDYENAGNHELFRSLSKAKENIISNW